MSGQRIDYGQLVEKALRGVVRDALALVAERGLPGRHHVYLTFRTDHPDVDIADDLRARYPNEMTIVLQHEYWDLEVRDEGFAVTLSFNDAPQRLEIPYAAVSVFADPSVEFGLQFAVPESLKGEEPVGEKADVGPARPPASISELPPKPAGRPGGEEGGGEVVTLDRFRKK